MAKVPLPELLAILLVPGFDHVKTESGSNEEFRLWRGYHVFFFSLSFILVANNIDFLISANYSVSFTSCSLYASSISLRIVSTKKSCPCLAYSVHSRFS